MTRIAAISVAISTMDRPLALSRCLAALWSADVLPAETVIVDQSRDERTQSVVQACRSKGMNILYVRQEPRGLGASQNAAFAHARYPLVAVIDDDCVADPAWLATIEQVLATCPALDGVTGRVLPLEPEGDRVYPISVRQRTQPIEFYGKVTPWRVGSGNNFALKRDWYLRIGGCDERLGPGSPGQGGVDIDLFYRLLRAGARIRFEPASLVYHERQTRAGRLARRPMYGRGLGACCTIWLRQGDPHALRVLTQWLRLRARLMAAALRRRQWLSIYEEWLMLQGTARGLVYGLLVNEPAQTPSEDRKLVV